MKSLRFSVAACAAALALLSIAAPAQADRGWHGGGWHGGGWHGGSHWRGGVFLNFGVPYPYYYWGSPYVYGPAYAYPPAVVDPPVYVERGDSGANATWWYWCDSARGYYPYVKECPSGWRRVPAQPQQ